MTRMNYKIIHGMTLGGVLIVSGFLSGCNRQTPKLINETPKLDTAVQGGSSLDAPLTQPTSSKPATSLQSPAPETTAKLKTNNQVTRAIELHDVEPEIISAIQSDDLKHLRAILERSPELADKAQEVSPLRIAASLGLVEICRYLIEVHHVDVNDFDRGLGGYPIIKEALEHPQVVRLLIEHGADLKTRITWPRGVTGFWVIGTEATLLHYAAHYGAPETVTLLIDNGVDIFSASAQYPVVPTQTALDVAAYFGKTKNAMAMLNHPHFLRANEQQRRDLLDKSLLVAAAEYSNLWTWTLLMPGSEQQSDFSPVGAEKRQLIKSLFEKGADPNAANKEGNAIQLTVGQVFPGNEKVNEEIRNLIILLLENGTKIHGLDDGSEKPPDWVDEFQFSELKKALRDYEAKKSSENDANCFCTSLGCS